MCIAPISAILLRAKKTKSDHHIDETQPIEIPFEFNTGKKFLIKKF